MKINSKKADDFFNSYITKNVVIYTVIILIFWVFKSWFNSLIENYLTFDSSYLDTTATGLLIILTVFGLAFILYKFVIKKYDPSTFVKRSIGLVLIAYLLLRYTTYSDGYSWYFIEFWKKFKFIDFIGVLFFTYYASLIGITIWRKNYRTRTDFTINPFSSDDPITAESEDKLNYKTRAIEIIDFLEVSNFRKSFTIGIVGPWGNGKSSLIEMMQRQLEVKELHETIHLKFLPYLNHSESDIISEFFNQLSNELNKHSGKLANYLVDYSEKLLKLYKNKSIKEFVTPNNPSISTKNTSLDFYIKINEVLKKLDKRFIIFIDDLDRLSSKEVLQVLKLVRNTANFRNFIFVIALDKDYVLNTLISKNDISDHTFVDKFFQLEVYLPEIDKTQLKSDFLELLTNSGLQGEPEFLDLVETAIYKTTNLFDDYVTNHRSAKRLVNQLVFDHKVRPDELDASDFLNFTYLKLSFPAAIKYLNNNWRAILPYNSENKLRELEPAGGNVNSGDVLNLVRNIRLFTASSRFNPKLDDYKITVGIQSDDTLKSSTQLSEKQNVLLAKTLIALFGKENNKPRHTSIKFGNNLQKLLQQKTNNNELTHSEFEIVIKADDDFITLENMLQADKTQELLNRIAYYSTDDIVQVKKITLLLLHIFDKAEYYGTYALHTLQILNDFLSANAESKENLDAAAIWENIKSTYLDGDYTVYRKLELIAFLSENRVGLNFGHWGTTEEELKALSLQIYEQLLSDKTGVLWDSDDYSFYHAYHNVRKLHPPEVLNPLVQDFWNNNDVKMLCAQMTQNDAWTVKMLKTSDHAATIFESKDIFKEFIFKRTEGSTDPAIVEYREFLELEYFSNFSSHLRYDFKHFIEINQKLKQVKINNRMKSDDFENVIEIFVESTSSEAHSATNTSMGVSVTPGFINNQSYKRDDRFFSKVRVASSDAHSYKKSLLDHYKRMLRSNESYVINNKEMTIAKDDIVIIEIISIQPEEYNI